MARPLVASPRQYKPGDIAPVSGIYAVIHDRHRPPHEVLVIRGEEFPPCRTCKLDVVFEAIQTVEHMTHDLDFAGPLLSTLQFRSRRKGPEILNRRRG